MSVIDSSGSFVAPEDRPESLRYSRSMLVRVRREMALTMRHAGMSTRALAFVFNVSVGTMHNWLQSPPPSPEDN